MSLAQTATFNVIVNFLNIYTIFQMPVDWCIDWWLSVLTRIFSSQKYNFFSYIYICLLLLYRIHPIQNWNLILKYIYFYWVYGAKGNWVNGAYIANKVFTLNKFLLRFHYLWQIERDRLFRIVAIWYIYYKYFLHEKQLK